MAGIAVALPAFSLRSVGANAGKMGAFSHNCREGAVIMRLLSTKRRVSVCCGHLSPQKTEKKTDPEVLKCRESRGARSTSNKDATFIPPITVASLHLLV